LQFAIWFCEHILGEDADDAREIYHIGGAGDHKVDIGIADEDHETVIVAQCKYSNTPFSAVFSADLPASVKDATDRLVSIPDLGNTKRRKFANAYKDIDDDDKPKRRLAVGFGRFSEDAQLYAQSNGIELYDVDRIKQLYEISAQPTDGQVPASITFHVDLSKDTIRRTLTSPAATEIITIVRAGDIYNAVKEHRHKLFEQNLRYKLRQTARTRIAGEIKNTLRDEPGALHLLNNGLTVLCADVFSADGKLVLTHPQIVNGCQSSWAIYEALDDLPKNEREQRKSAEILVRIVKAADSSLSSRIAQATNQQNAIAQRDLKANDNGQAQIAASFDRLAKRVFFERKDGALGALKKQARESYQVVKSGAVGRPPVRIINNTSAGQIYLAVLGLPYYSKQNKKQIFDAYYPALFGVDSPNRFDGLADGPDLFQLKNGADAFRDDVLFGFAILQLVEAVSAIYQDKLNLYPESQKLSALQESARQRLIVTCGYMKTWQYFAVSCFVGITQLWAHRKHVDEKDVRSALVGDDYDIFFGSVSHRKSVFNIEANLDHAFVLDEANPSSSFVAFAAWFVTLSKQMDHIVDQHLKTNPTSFRWNAFIDQRADTFKDMRKWWEHSYTLGEAEWKKLFPM
jgi:hypothetical protein